METIEIRLVGGVDPDGSIDLALFAPIAVALDELSGRVVRWQAGRHGPGRPPTVLERLAKVRLIAVNAGSTRLTIIRGDDAALDVDATEFDDAFWAVLTDVAGHDPAPSTPDDIKESALRFADAVARAAPVSSIRSENHPRHSVHLVASEVRRSAWSTSIAAVTTTGVFAGILEEANLRSARFAIRDDAGNRIRLAQVSDLEEARHLLGERVVASGAVRRAGKDWAIEEPTRLLAQRPLHFEPAPEIEDELEKVGPVECGESAPGGELLDDEQFAAFMEAARGA